jgi:biopolymer transport protein ExbB
MHKFGWVLGLCLSAGLACQSAFGWADSQWTYRKQITIDTTPSGASVTAELRNFPVLIRLDSSTFNFEDAKQDGSDIRFYAGDDKTALPFRLESFDAKTGLAAIWVSVPDVQGSAQTKIFMYFGNKKAGVAPVSGPVFDPLYKAIYHFGAGEKVPADDTTNRNDGLNQVAVKAGWIGQGARFDGTASAELPPAVTANAAQGFSFEAWVKPRDASASGVVFAAGSFVVGLDKGQAYVETGPGQRSLAPAALTGDWTFLTATISGSTITLYVNGLPAATLTSPQIQLANPSLAGSPSQSSPKFAGEMDEVRLSATARSAAYVKAAFAAEGAGGHLSHVGPTEQPADAGFGYFGVIFKSVTVDAWVVIAILAAMGVMSWIVMWTKGGYAGRTSRANRAFLSAYDNLKGDVLTLEEGLSARDSRELKHSSLFRLYQVGASELSARQEALNGAKLSQENLQAIRASLDATLVEENAKLDSNMVLLTISIAGAPFIGLLGTVLGVMITFASIAAAGEVNVNAIAPGIAAALLATVAGLAVAIPALFGYNYISSKNTAIGNQTQIFGDRLLTRFAEWQRHGSAVDAAVNAATVNASVNG